MKYIIIILFLVLTVYYTIAIKAFTDRLPIDAYRDFQEEIKQNE